MNHNNAERSGGPIIVVGGYGSVGRVVAEALGEWFPGRVTVAGRDPRRAEDLARSSGGALRAMRVDVGDPGDVSRMLRDAAAVVMCVERGNEEVARASLERGVHYADVSATTAVLESIAGLNALAARNAATAVLSVGVAPGLTNLLARHCVERLPSAERVDISLLLGMGGEHGADSVRWIVENLTRPDGRHRSHEGRSRTWLHGFGLRTVHPFPFSDQYTISEALGVRATTRICFDSALVTSLLFAFRSARFFALMRRLRAEPLLTSVLSRLRFGSDRFVVHARARDREGTAVSSTVTGEDTSNATGIVTAYAVRELLTAPVPSGVLHLDELVSADAFLDGLRRHRIGVRHGPAEHRGPHSRRPRSAAADAPIRKNLAKEL